MQRLYCNMTDFSEVDKYDPYITIYGDNNSSSITQDFVENLRLNLADIKQIVLEDIQKINNRAFANLNAVQFEVVLPSTLLNIGDYAFMNSGIMGTVIIPASLTYLGVGAFYGCEYLEYIHIEESITITEIPVQFCHGSAIKCVRILYTDETLSPENYVYFPNSITSIAENAFEGCAQLGPTLNLSNNVTHIGDYAFYNSGITYAFLSSNLLTGSSATQEMYQDANYSTARTLTYPYTLYLTSKRQFRYNHFVSVGNHAAGFIYRINNDFKYCLDSSHLMVFKNGLLLPPTYYYLHSIVNNPVNDAGIVFNVALEEGDVIDIFYVTNDLHHLECDYYDTNKRERYIKNGLILLNSHHNEYRVMGEKTYKDKTWRSNYIRMRSPLYAVSSKHSAFVFLNGKKVRFDELEDISDTIIAINSDYARNNDDMNAIRLEVINHLDTQDIIEHLFINDGLNHTDLIAQYQFINTNKPNAYKDTLRIKSWSLSDLESYAERTKLDQILNDISDEALNKLFYDWTATGPMTPYDETAFNEPDFINPDEIIPEIIDEYYFEEDGDKFIWHTIPTSGDVEGESNTIFYIGNNQSVKVPVRWNNEDTRALYGTTFNRNETIRKVVIPEGVESIE